MTRLDQTDIAMRIVIDRPVIGVGHRRQAGKERVFDRNYSDTDELLAFDFPFA